MDNERIVQTIQESILNKHFAIDKNIDKALWILSENQTHCSSHVM